MQRRLNDCYRQQRFPYPGFGSDATIALGVYMGVNAQGRRVDRAGHQALKEARMMNKHSSSPPRRCSRRRSSPAAPRCPRTADYDSDGRGT